jgi:hypothetical protein
LAWHFQRTKVQSSLCRRTFNAPAALAAALALTLTTQRRFSTAPRPHQPATLATATPTGARSTPGSVTPSTEANAESVASSINLRAEEGARGAGRAARNNLCQDRTPAVGSFPAPCTGHEVPLQYSVAGGPPPAWAPRRGRRDPDIDSVLVRGVFVRVRARSRIVRRGLHEGWYPPNTDVHLSRTRVPGGFGGIGSSR